MDLGRRAYAPVHALQERLVTARGEGTSPDTLLLVEHDPVYTLGRRAETRHLVFDDAQRQVHGIDLVRTARGGDVTYHGPGQLVGYPILHLGALGLGAVSYVNALEEMLIATLREFDVNATRDPDHRGVWVGRDKIAAIGVRIARQISMHGFALNVDPDMAHFAGIVPCGIQGRGVTALRRLRPEASMTAVKAATVRMFKRLFEYDGIVMETAPPDGAEVEAPTS